MASERYKAAWKRFKRGPHDIDAPEFREHALDFRALTPRTLAHQPTLALRVALESLDRDAHVGAGDGFAARFATPEKKQRSNNIFAFLEPAECFISN